MEHLSYALKAFRKWLFSSSLQNANAIVHPSFIQDNPGEWKYISNDWRIVARYTLITPFTSFTLEQWSNKIYTHLRLKADDAKQLYIEFRSTWPANVYFEIGKLQTTDEDAAARNGVYLASFERYDDGTARLVLKESPSIVGYISFDLEGIMEDEYQLLKTSVTHAYNF
ncbi:hypothetical protein [Hymenobacter sp. GOD-10R]|uniref:hypothetical protein n=1 Tax=Hymenobacter sp. GOD-10R TaxID=3093922 RepID=UPI002D79E425|nr:hypothetical protein [Hymenobacter sp. GOD-10R]WRQ29714.1 hypothetical protein SD425_05485 [Hymenobacter sp. GOD-10R]